MTTLAKPPDVDGEIVPASPANDLMPAAARLATMSPQQIDMICRGVEQAVLARKRISQSCLKAAEPTDLVDFGGKPYLQGVGARRIAGLTGMELSRPDVQPPRWVGDDCFSEVLLEIYWPLTGYRAVEIGSCNTRDKFFAGKEGETKQVRLNQFLAQVNNDRELATAMLVADVKKKATENAWSRAVSGALGIRGMSWESLAALGFNPNNAGGQVKFKKNADAAAKANGGRSQDAPFVALADIQGTAVDSVINTAGSACDPKETTKGDKTYWNFRLADGSVRVSCCRSGGQPDWYEEGIPVDVRAKVTEYKGQKQLWVFEANPASDGPPPQE